MASYSKVVTGLTGLNVAKNPTHTLGVLYRYDFQFCKNIQAYRAGRRVYCVFSART